MAQFDAHKNASKKTSVEFPYLLEDPPDLIIDSTRIVIVSLVLASTLVHKDPTLNPEFDVEGSRVALFHLDRASMSKNLPGGKVANIGKGCDRVAAAQDLLFVRFETSQSKARSAGVA